MPLGLTLQITGKILGMVRVQDREASLGHAMEFEVLTTHLVKWNRVMY